MVRRSEGIAREMEGRWKGDGREMRGTSEGDYLGMTKNECNAILQYELPDNKLIAIR